MKKVFTLVTAFVFVGLVACGPSAEEKAAQEAALQQSADSVANALLEQASEAAAEPVMEAAAGDSAAGHEGHDHAAGETH